ncbi:MAG: hypothetical protein M9962_15160 [Oligoflexia bacterium]|nr:hypothetical protein [Oligoflexia bacterium]
MTLPNFHLSIAVKSLEDSVFFFTQVLEAKIIHEDPSGYINIDLYGNQITLKHDLEIDPNLPHLHFGINMKLDDFNMLADRILNNYQKYIALQPEVWDENTKLERKKMYLRCPTGYLIELKGYR